MVQPGASPATFEPLPAQLLKLDRTDIYMQSGVPFEKIWLPRIRKNHPGLEFIDTLDGIELLPVENMDSLTSHADHEGSEAVTTHSHDHGQLDPHVWLSPALVKIQARAIYEALCEHDSVHVDEYRENMTIFQKDLDVLSREIQGVFDSIKNKNILVFHPAWGHFAHEFGLHQIAIESEGKEPGPRELVRITEYAREHGVQVIFVQSQFNTDIARAIADQIDAVVVPIDPLAEDYINNLSQVARKIAHHLSGSSSK